MSSTGNGKPWAAQFPQWNGRPNVQNNIGNQSNMGQNVYATQKGNIRVNNGLTRPSAKPVLIILGTDVLFFFYGMLSYSGASTSGDGWRAAIFLVLVIATFSLIGRWVRGHLR
jgi:hypothetical protein